MISPPVVIYLYWTVYDVISNSLFGVIIQIPWFSVISSFYQKLIVAHLVSRILSFITAFASILSQLNQLYFPPILNL